MKKKLISPENRFLWPAFDWKNLPSADWTLYFYDSLFKVKLKESPNFLWAKIVNQGLPNIEFRTELGGEKLHKSMKDIEAFDFSLPSTGAYNFKNTVFFFFRKFTRQWRKGICRDSSAFESILEFYKIGNKIAPLIGKSFDVSPNSFFSSPKNVSDLFNCKYYSFQEAYKVLEEKKAVARAISKDMVLSLGARSSSPILWLSSIPVGYVESSKPELSLLHPEIEAEILRLIPTASIISSPTKESKDNEFLELEANIAF